MGEFYGASKISIEQRAEANDHFDYGLTFELKGDTDKALDFFIKAVACDPDFAEAYNKLGDIFMKKAKYKEAIEAYCKSAAIKPDIENTHFDLGCAYLQTMRLDEAEKEFKIAFELDPHHYEILGKLGAVCVEKKEYEQALGFMRKMLVADPTAVAARYYNGLALYMMGKKAAASAEFSEVIARYSALIKIKPNYAEAHYFIGMAYFYNANYKEAELNLKRAIELDTDKIDFHYSLGLAYSDADVFYAMANVQKVLNNEAAAAEFLKKAAGLEPQNPKFNNYLI
jgi:superkiller protein 3